MLVNIRRGVFETNSSSSHSVTIKGNEEWRGMENLPKNENNEVEVELGWYSWGPDELTTPSEKLSYLVTMIAEDHNYDEDNFDFEKSYKELPEIKQLESELKEYGYSGIVITDFSDYCIDHQSLYTNANDAFSYQNFLKDWHVTSVAEFLFNPGICVIIDNDNH